VSDNGGMPVFLETERLVLRHFTAGDAGNLYDLNDDPDVMWFLTGGEPTPRERIENHIIPRFLGFHERSGWQGYWAAEVKPEREFIGWFHLLPDEDGSVDLGYRLRKAAWNKGYATEASRALIRKCFTELGVDRMTAHTMTVNRASRRVMEKCGLTLFDTHPSPGLPDIPGAEQGEVVYALTRRRWEETAR
jgi:RimJ/RimL family protein N-acetyltransferase